MNNVLTLELPEDETPLPLVFVPATSLPPSVIPEAGPGAQSDNPPVGPATRLHRVKIINWAPPSMLVEATPDAARDLQELTGIKQIDPSPEDCAPDRCGSAYFTLILSMLFDLRVTIARIEQFNQLDALPDAFLTDSKDGGPQCPSTSAS